MLVVVFMAHLCQSYLIFRRERRLSHLLFLYHDTVSFGSAHTVWKFPKFTFTIISQKFRQINLFRENDFIQFVSRNFIQIRVNFSIFHTVVYEGAYNLDRRHLQMTAIQCQKYLNCIYFVGLKLDEMLMVYLEEKKCRIWAEFFTDLLSLKSHLVDCRTFLTRLNWLFMVWLRKRLRRCLVIFFRKLGITKIITYVNTYLI